MKFREEFHKKNNNKTWIIMYAQRSWISNREDEVCFR